MLSKYIKKQNLLIHHLQIHIWHQLSPGYLKIFSPSHLDQPFNNCHTYSWMKIKCKSRANSNNMSMIQHHQCISIYICYPLDSTYNALCPPLDPNNVPNIIEKSKSYRSWGALPVCNTRNVVQYVASKKMLQITALFKSGFWGCFLAPSCL